MGQQPRVTIDGFTRQEVIRLTGCNSNRLSYLEKVGLVTPTRIGSSKKPTVLYTWEQMLEIRAIRDLRREISLQTVRSIVDFLNKSGIDDSLRDKQLVVVNNEVFWVKVDFSDIGQIGAAVQRVASRRRKGIGQYLLLVIPPLVDIVNEIWETASQSQVVDFESFKLRAKARPA
jgi:DNA-binding transcriptional MerR regulator